MKVLEGVLEVLNVEVAPCVSTLAVEAVVVKLRLHTVADEVARVVVPRRVSNLAVVAVVRNLRLHALADVALTDSSSRRIGSRGASPDPSAITTMIGIRLSVVPPGTKQATYRALRPR